MLCIRRDFERPLRHSKNYHTAESQSWKTQKPLAMHRGEEASSSERLVSMYTECMQGCLSVAKAERGALGSGAGFKPQFCHFKVS